MTFASIAARAARTARLHANGIQVVVCRDGECLPVMATVGTTRREQQQNNGFITRLQIRDFLIDVCDYPFGEPQIDDEIHEIEGNRTYVYRLMSPGNSEEPYRYSDRHRITWRLHTQLVAS